MYSMSTRLVNLIRRSLGYRARVTDRRGRQFAPCESGDYFIKPRGFRVRQRGDASATWRARTRARPSLVGGLQARRGDPVIHPSVGLEQLNFLKKFISLWTRRYAVSFTRALLRHTHIINLFHVVSPRKQRPNFSGRLKVMGRLHLMRIENETRNHQHGSDGQHPRKRFRGRPLGD